MNKLIHLCIQFIMSYLLHCLFSNHYDPIRTIKGTQTPTYFEIVELVAETRSQFSYSKVARQWV